MQTVARQSEDEISGANPLSVDHFCAIDDSHDRAREIVLPRRIHPRHLRGFAADNRAPGRLARFRESAKQLDDDPRLELFGPDVIQKKERARANDSDVINAMIHEILAHRVMASGAKRDFQFGADAIDARDQNRIPKSAKIGPEKSAESVDARKHFGA